MTKFKKSPKQKLYCFVDETGQDTKGCWFLVSVIIIEKDKDSIEKCLLETERESKKFKTKWHRAKFFQREAYLNKISKLKQIQKSIYYSSYQNSVFYYDLITLTTAKAIYDRASENYQASIVVDGLQRNLEKKIGVSLRRLNIRVAKIKGARDESSPFIRLADAISGLVRDAYEGNKWSKEKLNKLVKEDIVHEI